MEQLSLPLPLGSAPGAAEPPPADPASIRSELAEQYCQRHRNIENYLLVYALAFGLLRRLRIDPVQGPRQGRGQLAAVLLVAMAMVGPALALTALLDEWAIAPIGTWLAVGVALGLLVVHMHSPLLRAIDSFLSLHRTTADEAGMRRLIAWEQRWFRRRVEAPLALLFSASLLFYLYYIEEHYGERSMAWGTALIGFLLLYGVGEIIYSVMLLALESYVLRECNYDTYRLSPLDSVAMRRTIRGSSQLGLLVSVVATMFICGFVVLLGDRPIMVTQVGLLLLGLAYVATLAGVLLPRLAIKSIVQAQKEQALVPLQRRIEALAARVGELTDEQYTKLKRLKEAHDTIRDATEEVLPLRALGRLAGALILPTLTFVGSRFGETILQRLLHQIRH
jgi:hypothetical protein